MAKPTHTIYQIEDRGEGNKPFWREVGVAWTNTDGSLNLKFAVTPHFEDNTIQVRANSEKPDTSSDSTPAAKPSRRRQS